MRIDNGTENETAWRADADALRVELAAFDEADDDTMPCGCESGSCYCDTIDRDWAAYEAGR